MDKPSVALHILDKLLQDACDETLLEALATEKALRAQLGRAEPLMPNNQGELERRNVLVERPGVDIYGQPKTTESRYFTCRNCERAVGGSRFAVHVSKCVTRGRRQRTNF